MEPLRRLKIPRSTARGRMPLSGFARGLRSLDMQDHSSTPRPRRPYLILAALALGACSSRPSSTPSIEPRDANVFIACRPERDASNGVLVLQLPPLTLIP